MNKEFANIDGSAKKTQKESLTPYKVAVLMFIKLYCNETNKTVIERRDFCVASLKLIQSPDLNKKSLFKIIDSSDFILQRLSHQLSIDLEFICTEGVKELLDLFDSLGVLMKSVTEDSEKLNKHSVLGLYVRRAIMLFEKLNFYKIVSLFEDLQAYVDENSDYTISMDRSEKDQTLFNNDNEWGGRQAELLVAQQAHALLTDEHKALPPAELQSLVKDLLSSSPYYAEAHYLSYLNCLRVNEYCGALESLYHCFDRLTPVDNRPVSEDKLRTFRYAALNLAALHAQFGYKELARLALKETIMLAQEAGDNICLQLAHSWVYYLMDKNKSSLIARSMAKANSLGMAHTSSLALIAAAHDLAMEGQEPVNVFEALMRSDHLNYEHSMVDLMSMIYAEKTALWAYYGKTEMSSICAQLLLLFNSGEKKQLMFNGPSTCQAVVTIANILHEMGEYALANVVLGHAKERFPNKPSNRIWSLSEQLHEFDKLIRNEKWSAAEEIAMQISSLDKTESKFRLAEVYFARHSFSEALKLAYELEAMEDTIALHKIRVKLLINQIKCGSVAAGNPQSATNCILLLNNALDIAKKNHLSYYEALVNMHIVNVQLLLQMPFQALKNVKDSLIKVLAHGGLYDQARAHITYAKCLIANATRQKDEDEKDMLHDAIKYLLKAKKLLQKLDANNKLKITLYLLSVCYHEVNMTEERNNCAFQFKVLDQQFPTEKIHAFLF
ncbi:anaphase-promoting complex subunit 5 [Trichogramma pretiosum]|uniref:anaphase-promoting complex subunit 5 n=1 Tax=Trichogramma pretiosum TaxID=7493 RepID=UPI0006C945A5|nr:anaphase-promoting complex subunit 5 [Trichogramma pretiosum]